MAKAAGIREVTEAAQGTGDGRRVVMADVSLR